MEPGDEDLFVAASKFMRATNLKLDNDKKLKLYGLYKQATEGDCHTSKPSILDMTGRAKWTAWNGLKGLSKAGALTQYVEFVTILAPEWQSQEVSEAAAAAGGGGISSPFGAPSVSTMVLDDDNGTSKKIDSEKTIMELVADGNVDIVRRMLAADRSAVSTTDDQGMSALHWACDRGNESLVAVLLENGANVNAQDSDGQTPLHYVVSCDHVGLVPVLVGSGADGSITDADGDTAASGADSSAMRTALEAVGL